MKKTGVYVLLMLLTFPASYASADSQTQAEIDQTLSTVNDTHNLILQERAVNYFQGILDAGLNYAYNTKLVSGGNTIGSGYVKPIVAYNSGLQTLTVIIVGKYVQDKDIKKIFTTITNLLNGFNNETADLGFQPISQNLSLIYKDVDNFDTIADQSNGVYTSHTGKPFNAGNGK